LNTQPWNHKINTQPIQPTMFCDKSYNSIIMLPLNITMRIIKINNKTNNT